MKKLEIQSHFMLLGPPGSGKKTLANLFLNELYDCTTFTLSPNTTRTIATRERLYNFADAKMDNQKVIVIERAETITPAFVNVLQILLSKNVRLCFIANKTLPQFAQFLMERTMVFELFPRTHSEHTNIAKRILMLEKKSCPRKNLDSMIKQSNGSLNLYLYLLQMQARGFQNVFKYIESDFPSERVLSGPLRDRLKTVQMYEKDRYSLSDIASFLYNYLLMTEKDPEQLLEIGKTCVAYSQYEHDPYELYACVTRMWLREFADKPTKPL